MEINEIQEKAKKKMELKMKKAEMIAKFPDFEIWEQIWKEMTEPQIDKEKI